MTPSPEAVAIKVSFPYLPPERSENVVRTGTLFPIALARWRANTAGWTAEQLVSLAASLFLKVMLGAEDEAPFDPGPADVAAVLTLLAERRHELALREAVLTG